MKSAQSIDFNALNQEFIKLSYEDRLKRITQIFTKVALATSFGKEDQVITDMIARLELNIDLFTLDTGRLFDETYQTWHNTTEKYNLKITPYYPEVSELQKFVKLNGVNSFYSSTQNRIECCRIRKITGLKKALSHYDCWIVGLRAEQSKNRANMPVLANDTAFSLAKLSSLMEWSERDVDEYIKKYQVPVNPLHDKGFVSIGCAPCTRAIEKGQDFRSGRWWWEQSSKECGLHQTHS